MNSRSNLLVTVAALTFVCAIAHAQQAEAEVLANPDLANARALLMAGRAEIIREDLRLTAAEEEGFWPVYDAYIEALTVVRDRKAKLVAGFLQAYDAGEFTEEYATWLVGENFGIKEAWLQVQRDFEPNFRVVLPAVKVARFYQLENKMDAETDAKLALVIPLVE